MLTRTLGHTDLSVTPLCLGGNVFGWTADEATSLVEQVRELRGAVDVNLSEHDIEILNKVSA